ncbi:MAG: 50S ribosomal protein L20 [bacterium]
MSRARNAAAKRKRRKKTLEMAKGYRGMRSNSFRRANENVERALNYAYRDRRTRKRDFRRLWITRINAAARQNGMTYSALMSGLSKADVRIDRKVLADLAVHDPEGFKSIAEKAQAALS